MKINIIKTIDTTLLDKALDDYNYETSQIPKYIIMNNDTLKAIEQSARKSMFLPQITEENIYRIYNGYPIAFCNKLKFGEIEIV